MMNLGASAELHMPIGASLPVSADASAVGPPSHRHHAGDRPPSTNDEATLLGKFLADPRVKPVTSLPPPPYDPKFVLATPALACYLSNEEKVEILEYDQVYTVGRVLGSEKSVTVTGAAAPSSTDCPKPRRYNGVPSDHIGYRFLCNKVEGRGTFAVVLSATDEKNQSQQVALKVLSILPNHNADAQQNEKTVKQEISILQRLHQSAPDNFVNFFERVEFRQHTVLVFELLGVDLGTDLRNRYRERGVGYTLTEVQLICRQMVHAMQVMLSNNTVHADFKPNNIMIKTNGVGEVVQLKVIDFGRAFREADSPHSGWCQNACYAAPDQVLGCRIGPGVDHFAAGCIAFELLTGELLFNVHPEASCRQQMFHFLSALGKPSTGITLMPSKFGRLDQYFHSTGQPRSSILRGDAPGSVILTPPHYISVPATPTHRLMLKKAPAHAVSFVLSLLDWEPEKRRLAFSHCFLDARAHSNSCISLEGCGDHICCRGT